MTTAMLPVDLGIPTRFPKFRDGQYEMAVDLASSPSRFMSLSAPPGAGKSLIYMSVAAMLGARALVLVGTKALQDQLIADFKDAGMFDMRGQSNYRCVALDRQFKGLGRPGAGCDEGPCHVGVYCSLKQDGGCLYFDAQANAKEASIVVTNYSYWMSLGRYSDPKALGDFDLLILDEAHGAPSQLADFCTVTLERLDIKFYLDMDLPPVDEGVTVWAQWAKRASKKAQDKAAAYRRTLESAAPNSDRLSLMKSMLHLTDLARNLEQLAMAGTWKQSEGSRVDVRLPGLQTDWIVEPYNKTRKTTGKSDGIRFSPVWAHAYAESVLFRNIPKVLLVSATLSKSVPTYLGIKPEENDYREMASTFDAARRPIIHIPTTRVDRHMTDGQVRLWVKRIDQVIAGRLDRKGLIHTGSYERAKQIMERSEHHALLLSHNSVDTRDVIERFKRSEAPCVLVSPSVKEGVDFPGLECLYQIISKIPFIDGRSPVIKARVKSDKMYLNYVAAITFLQMCGRPVRSADDFAETFVIDDHWRWFRRLPLFPKWFRQAWQQVDVVPKAPVLPEMPKRHAAKSVQTSLAARKPVIRQTAFDWA